MTEQEYIEIMDNSNFFINNTNPYDMEIKKALKKQIPKKMTDDGYHHITCDCEHRIDMCMRHEISYCPYCGQAIKW